MRNTRILFTIGILLVFFKGHSQIHISNEVGVIAGPAAFFTDYGERWNIRSNLENGGFGIGLVHYMNFSYREECSCYRDRNFFSEHFRIRNEIDYFQSKLEHVGPVAIKDDAGGEQLRAMHGFTEMWEFGTHLEYYPIRITDFTNFGYWFSPYISLGAHYVRYSPSAYSDLGSLDNPKVVFPTFQGGINLEPDNALAVIFSIGVRARLGERADLLMDARWQYYDTDLLDGLDVQGPQNQANDFVFWFNVGYIYYLNF